MRSDYGKRNHFPSGKAVGQRTGTEKKERLQRIKDTLEIGDNDAMLAIISAMEYQCIYYEKLPEKNQFRRKKILVELSVATEREACVAQSQLPENLLKQAEKLSRKIHIR